MIAQTLRQTIRQRPITTFAVTTSTTALGYATYREYNANKNDIQLSQAIPRNHYDATAIASYWEQRPISIVKRLMNIVCELGPVAGEYVYEFHLKPWIDNELLSSGNNDATTTATTLTLEQMQQQQELQSELSIKLRTSLTNLGPTFVKVGQQLSIRPDLVSPIVLHELQRLCDAVPPFDDEVAMQVLAEELQSVNSSGGENAKLIEKDVRTTILNVFEDMPKLVASASLGQVYKATLRGGNNVNGLSTGPKNNASATKTSNKQQQEVAIKIQRPDILETVSLDLFLLVSYGKTVDKICSVLTNQIPYHEIFLNGFCNGAYMELNYVHEAENQMYFRKELHARFHGTGGSSSSSKDGSSSSSNSRYRFRLPFLHSRAKINVEKVIVPEVHTQYSTQRILVSEWIDGVPLAQSPPEQIRELIPIGVELFLCQLLDIGRFHADPHP